MFGILNPKNSGVITLITLAKFLFINIQKEYNTLKSSLIFKKNTNFRGE